MALGPPIVQWDFREGSGTTANDRAPGTAQNVTLTPGASGAWDTSGGANKTGYNFAGTASGITGLLTSTKVQTAFAGATTATLEFAIDSAASTSTYDEYFKLQDGSGNGIIGITVNHSQGGLLMSASEGSSPNDGSLKYAIATSGIIIGHMVVDSTQATAANRVRLYIAGSAVTPTIVNQLGLNAALDQGVNWSTVRANFGEAGALIGGKVRYLCLYGGAGTAAEVAANAANLANNDDADPNVVAAVDGWISRFRAKPPIRFRGPGRSFVQWPTSSQTAANLTLSLTGVSSTAAVGTVGPSAAVPLIGNASAGAAGTIAPALSVGLTGAAATGAVGTVTVSGADVTLALTGVASTAAVGTLGPGTSVPVTGVAAAAAVGTLVPSVSLALTGAASTTAVGTVAPGTSKGITGTSSAAAVGTLAPALSLALTGVAASGLVGNVTSSGGTPTAAVALSRWKLDETSGTTLADSIGSNTLTLGSGYTLNVTPPAVLTSSTGAIRGTTACVAARTSATGLPNGSASQSWSMWIKATSNSGTQAIFSLTNSALTAGAGLFISGGTLLMLEYNGSATLVSATAPSTGSWHHVAWTYDASTNSNLLYVDGTQVGSATATPTTSTTADVILTTSDSGSTNPFAGDIDDIRVFSGVLTAAQITRMAAGGEPNDTTLALTGVSSTSAVGTVGPGRSLALTGAASSSAAGTLGVAISLALTGAAAAGAAGTIGPGRSVVITGVAGTGAVGSVSPALSIQLTGAAAVTQVGTIGVNGNLTIALTGVASATAVGTIGPGRSVPVSGVVMTGAVGSLGVAVSAALSGVGAVGIAGNLSIPIPLVPLFPPFVAVLGSVQLTAESTGDTLSVTGDT